MFFPEADLVLAAFLALPLVEALGGFFVEEDLRSSSEESESDPEEESEPDDESDPEEESESDDESDPDDDRRLRRLRLSLCRRDVTERPCESFCTFAGWAHGMTSRAPTRPGGRVSGRLRLPS